MSAIPFHNHQDVRTWVQLPTLPQTAIRQSTLSTIASCKRKAMWRHLYGLSRAQHKSAPFIGQLFHLAHASRYLGLDERGVAMNLQRAVADYHEDLVRWAEETGEVDKAASLTAEVERDAALASAMSAAHWSKMPLNSGQFEVIKVEQELVGKVPGVGLPVAGRIDLVLKYVGEQQGLVIVDFKTTMRSAADFLATVKFNSQSRLYRILVHQNRDRLGCSGLPVLGIVHDVVKRPSIRWKQSQTFEEYLSEVVDWYNGDQGPLNEKGKPRWDHTDNRIKWASEPPFNRLFTYFDEDMYSQDLVSKLKLADALLRGTPWLTKFTTNGVDSGACVNSYGRSCEYLNLCSKDTAEWHDLAANHFVQSDLFAVSDQPQEEVVA